MLASLKAIYKRHKTLPKLMADFLIILLLIFFLQMPEVIPYTENTQSELTPMSVLDFIEQL